MSRAQFQILVLPFRIRANRSVEYGVLRRSDAGVWQGIAGGGEADESPTQAAIRETEEEAGVPKAVRYYRLQTTSSIPTYHFAARKEWPKDLYVIPEYAYAVDCTNIELKLSHEHTEIAWGTYEETLARMHWDSNKVALWELNERLLDENLPDSVQERG